MDSPDQDLLNAAEGWLVLGDYVSAFEELEKLPPLQCAHPDVLKLRWRIFAAGGKHDLAFAVADALVRLLPNESDSYLLRLHSARRMRDSSAERVLELARDTADRFPTEPEPLFITACCLCRLGRPDEARDSLRAAFGVAEKFGLAGFWKQRALDEPDLEPIWIEI